VNSGYDEVLHAIEESGVSTIQLHGTESPSFVEQFSLPVIKAFHTRKGFSLEEVFQFTGCTMLLEGWSEQDHGGNGAKAEWGIAQDLARKRRLILAGGLRPENVGEAIRTVLPFAVDVSSGIESRPGVKDHVKIREFVAAVRAADSELQDMRG
jgi:phosphoribosylanthranilate isomerase